MQIDTKQIKESLYEIKKQSFVQLDNTTNNKVKTILEVRISVLDALFMWLHKSEQQGELKMETLSLGELVKWEPKPRKNSIDVKIINDAKRLKNNFDAIKVTVEKVHPLTFINAVYRLAKDGKIDEHIVPRKDKDGNLCMVYLTEMRPKRRQKVG